MNAREIVIITGMSGAGRTTVANALEDLGWFVVDNLPPTMLKALVRTAATGDSTEPKLAIVVDVRGGALFDDAKRFVEMLRAEQTVRVLFLEASDAELVRRYEQVRRPHPLQGDGTILDGIRTERTRLEPLRGMADELLDTTGLNPHQLTRRVGERFAPGGELEVTLTVMSFGFKYGLPVDADLIADMRFLPNPFWMPELRATTAPSRSSPSTCCTSRARRSSRTATSRRSRPCSRGSRARTSCTPCSASAAPAASTARSRWPSTSRSASPAGPGCGSP
ncbi:UPF0042 nucleotide-binding protein [Agrococcus jenensis]|uniref:UPF0042 nucleotide-binding protein n=1 Tax=Agrococcus jenensis TaxID=46353 RepID=A0A3N2AVL1_9MICO|nr:UPF0042 nucleotide-binding protein [Agrococcus jenensis]